MRNSTLFSALRVLGVAAGFLTLSHFTQAQTLKTASGTANNFILTLGQNLGGSYPAGLSFTFISNQTITGAATLNVNGTGAINLVKNVNKPLVANDILAGQAVQVLYDGTNFQVLNVGTASTSTGAGTGNLYTFIATATVAPVPSYPTGGYGTNVIVYDTELYDTDNSYDPITGRFQPTTPGFYYLSGSGSLNGLGTNIAVGIFKNGVRYKDGGASFGGSGSTAEVSSVVYANGTTDYFQIYMYNNSGSTQPLLVGNTSYNFFSGFKINGGGTLTVFGFSGSTAAGISTLNGLTTTSQSFSTSSTGTSVNIVSSGNTHNFNVPLASVVGGNNITVTGSFPLYTISGLAGGMSTSQWVSTTGGAILYNGGNVGINTSTIPTEKLFINGNIGLSIGSTIGISPSGDRFTYGSGTFPNYGLGWYNDAWTGGGPTTYLAGWGGLKVFVSATNSSQPVLSIDALRNVSFSGSNFYVNSPSVFSGPLTISSFAGAGTQALGVNNLGQLVTISGGTSTSQWVSTTGGIYYNGGNVGIGTGNPLTIAHINSNSAGIGKGLLISGNNGALNLGDVFGGNPLTTPTWSMDNVSGQFRIYSQPNLITPGYVWMSITSSTGAITFPSLGTGSTKALGVDGAGQLVTIAGSNSLWIDYGLGGTAYTIPGTELNIYPGYLTYFNNNSIANLGSLFSIQGTAGQYAYSQISLQNDYQKNGTTPLAWDFQHNIDHSFRIIENTNNTFNDRLTILPNSGNVGIGTITPSALLDVNGSTRLAGPLTITSLATGGPTQALGVNNLGQLVTIAGGTGTSQWVNTSGGISYPSGSVGITLGNRFGLDNFSDQFLHNTNTVGSYSLGWYNDNWNGFGATGYLSAYGGMKFFTNSSPQPFMSVTQFGLIGINTTAPGATLDVNGSSRFAIPMTISSFAGAGTRALGVNNLGQLVTIAGGTSTSQWATDAGGIYYNNGSVSVGTTSNATFAPLSSAKPNGTGTIRASFGSTDTNNSTFMIAHPSPGLAVIGAYFGQDLSISSIANDNSSYIPLTTFKSNGFVGIATSTPGTTLDVNGNARFSGPVSITGLAGATTQALGVNSLGQLVTITGGTSTSQWVSTTNGIYYSGGNIGLKINPQTDLHLYNPTAGVNTRFETPISTGVFSTLEFKTGIYNSSASRSDAIWQVGLAQNGTAANPNDRIYIGRAGISSSDFAIYRDGNVGIGLSGTGVPSEKLTVLGNISASGIGYFSTIAGLALNGAAVGSIVTVDGIGRLGFGTLPSSSTSQWVSTTGGSIFYNQGGFVGINSAIPPIAHLDVNGISVFRSTFCAWCDGVNVIGTPTGSKGFIIHEGAANATSVNQTTGRYFLGMIGGDPVFSFIGNGLTTSILTQPNAMAQLSTINGGTFNVNGRIGIATPTPIATLDVNGSARIAGNLTITSFAGAGTQALGVNNLGQLVTVSGGTSTSQWVSTTGGIYYNGGNVGIGTNSPSVNLELSNSSASTGIRINAIGGLYYSFIDFANSGTNLWGLGNYNGNFYLDKSGFGNFLNISPTGFFGLGNASTTTPGVHLRTNTSVTGSLFVSGISTVGGLKVNNLTGPGTVTVDGLGNLGVGPVSGYSSAIASLNTLTATSQTFSTSSTGTSINITSSGSVHNFNIPVVTVVGGNNVTVSGGFPSYTISGLGGTSTSNWVDSGQNTTHTTGGKVGINTNNPLSRLDVRGNNVSTSSSSAEETFRVGSTDNTQLRLSIWMQTDPNPNNQYMALNAISAGNRSLLLQSTGGNVGIGPATALPNEKLTVQGNISVTGTIFAGTIVGNNLAGAAGSIVTVDGFGRLGLGSLSATASSPWVTTTNGIYYTSGKVGIGMVPISTSSLLEINAINGSALGIGGYLPAGTYTGLQFLNYGNDNAGLRWQGLSNRDLVLENASGTNSPNDWYINRTTNFVVRNGSLAVNTPASSTSATLLVNGTASISGLSTVGGLNVGNLAGSAGSIVTVDGLGRLGLGSLSATSSSQWVNSAATTPGIYYTGGKVGIGLSDPTHFSNVPFIVRGATAPQAIFGDNQSGVAITAGNPGIWFNSYFFSGGLRNMIAGYASSLGQNPVSGIFSLNITTASGTSNTINPSIVAFNIYPTGNTEFLGSVTSAGLTVKNLVGPGTVTVDGLGRLGVSTSGGSSISGSGTTNGVAFWANGTVLTADGANFVYTPITKSLKVGNAILSSNSLSGNVFFGANVGNQTMSGTDNNFFGTNIGQANTSGKSNNFFGNGAGQSNTTGQFNNFLGEGTGNANTGGSHNFYAGYQAGGYNISGSNNTHIGQGAGLGIAGDGNNYLGQFAGAISTGSYNNFLGSSAGNGNTSGTDNIFIGQSSGLNNTTGSQNIAIGKSAGFASGNITNGVAIGAFATVGGSSMIALGGTGSNSVNVGIGTGLPQNTIDVVGGARIRNLSVSGAVFANANGDLYISTVAGGTSNLWTVSGANLQPTSTYGVNLTSTATSYMIAGSDVLRIIPATNGNNILVGGAGNPTISTSGNVLVGQNAGSSIASGGFNTFMGDYAGTANSSGGSNTFYGFRSGASNNSGSLNTFIGYFAGNQNTSGGQNTFMGVSAGNNNSNGFSNTFIGNASGALNNIGGSNSFVGSASGNNNTSGSDNAFHGFRAGFSNSVASGNSYFGSYAGHNSTGANNTAIGFQTDITGAFSYAIALGAGASVNGSNMMAIGGAAGSGKQVSVGIGTGLPQNTLDVVGGARIRNLSVAGAVFATSNGDLYVNTATSSNLWTVSGTSLTPSNSSYGLNIGTNITSTGLVNISSATSPGLVVSSSSLPNQTGAIMGTSYSANSAGIGAFAYGANSVGLYGQATNVTSISVNANHSSGGTALKASSAGTTNPVAQIDYTGASTGTALLINMTNSPNTATGILINTASSSTTQAMDISGKIQFRNYTSGTLTVDGLGNLGVTTVTSNVGPGAGFLAVSTTVQSIPAAASWNTIQFLTEQFDDANAYSTVTYDYTAPTAGVYQVNASVPFANIGQVDIAIVVGLTNYVVVNSVSTSPTTGIITSVPISGIIKLAANQKVNIQIRQFTGQSQNTASSGTGANASFSMVKLY